MRSTITHNGEQFDAEVFEYDHHGYPLAWSVYDEQGEDFSDTLSWQEQDRIAVQLMYTREDALSEATFESWKE